MQIFPQCSQKCKKMLIFDEFGSKNRCGEKFLHINSMSYMPFLKFSQIWILALFFNARPTWPESFNMVFHKAFHSIFRVAGCN